MSLLYGNPAAATAAVVIVIVVIVGIFTDITHNSYCVSFMVT